MKPTIIRPLKDHVCFSAYTTVHAIQRLYQPTLTAHQLTYPQYLVLVALYTTTSQAVPVKTLSSQLNLSTGTLTPVLKRMTQAGLITRHRNPQDERSTLLTLTPQGTATRVALNDLPALLTAKGGLDQTEWQQLTALLNKLMTNLNAE
ncbi:MarR family winged helix-turn-helix transcriptional regulator [Lactiplantibacillus paraplantarum]|uniref:MarR family transcriptional regulator n=1 Tax=Lactiplantibacillus paraplantarum TaxID=60520 RepID=A0A2I9CL68_9LACO|nr:MarR family transcriptional regulator [Lactiplantibacillus paraplantarum]AVW09734.1 MarR family transcriptional regulator [Lactiplantibacillus paraplantarum]AYJ37948.1 MarR family transcriptional regulator [Lactiplantibacillus paraplantarum]ERL45522.1 transcription regulator [Lactiplantibacillus paraplantarum]KRL50164.1 transcription regulator [Lactiplantibacillus paraplantarum DSM 10667]MCU4682905.1 MarR family transcriptional regulator [Lactiplantibacillus paraplantarum]